MSFVSRADSICIFSSEDIDAGIQDCEFLGEHGSAGHLDLAIRTIEIGQVASDNLLNRLLGLLHSTIREVLLAVVHRLDLLPSIATRGSSRRCMPWHKATNRRQDPRQTNSGRAAVTSTCTIIQRVGIWMRSASCSFVSWELVNFRSTASFTIASRPTMLSGLTASRGKNSSRVRFALATGMLSQSA